MNYLQYFASEFPEKCGCDACKAAKPGGEPGALFKGFLGFPMGSVVKIVNGGDFKGFDLKGSMAAAKALADDLDLKLSKAMILPASMLTGKKPLASMSSEAQAFNADVAKGKLAAAYYKGPMRAPRYVKPALTPVIQAIGNEAVRDLMAQGAKSGMDF